QTSHLSRLVGKTAEAATGAHARSRRGRPRRTLDELVQSRHHHTGAAPPAPPRGRLCPLCYLPRTTGRPPARPRPMSPERVRLLRETTWSSKPVFSVEFSECVAPSSFTR